MKASLVVSQGFTQSKKMQIADLPSGTMGRISRARSLVSGVELWHPAKPLPENRVEFVHCIVIIMHCLLKTILQSPFCFLKRTTLIIAQTRVTGVFCFVRCQFAKTLVEINNLINYF